MKKIKFLFIILLIFLGNFTNLNASYSHELENLDYIYKSPKADYEFFLNTKKFLNFEYDIYAVKNDTIVKISRYYIPVKKISLKKGDYVASKDDDFIYLFNNVNRYLYRFDGKKIKKVKKLNELNAVDLEIYNDKFYFLSDKELIIFDKEFNRVSIKLKNFYKKIKILRDKIYLLSDKSMLILNLNEVTIFEYKDLKDGKSFDIDIDNKIYILDDNLIRIFDKDFKLLKQIYLNEKVKDIFFDISRALIVYFDKEGIKVIKPQYELKTIENIKYPQDITSDEEGNIYILSSSSSILVYDSKLNYKFSFKDNNLKHPKGIYYYKNKLFVSDSWNSKIRVFDKNGNFLYTFGEFGKDENLLCGPSRIKVKDDLIYVADTYNSKIKIFNLKGNLIKSFGQTPYKLLNSIIKPKNLLFEPIDVEIFNDIIFVVDKNIDIKIFDNEKSFEIKSNEIFTKILEYKEKIYLIGERGRLIYRLKNYKIVPIFSPFFIYQDSLKNIDPFSFYFLEDRIFILSRNEGKIYIINGELN